VRFLPGGGGGWASRVHGNCTLIAASTRACVFEPEPEPEYTGNWELGAEGTGTAAGWQGLLLGALLFQAGTEASAWVAAPCKSAQLTSFAFALPLTSCTCSPACLLHVSNHVGWRPPTVVAPLPYLQANPRCLCPPRTLYFHMQRLVVP
jgi:hypothetical protein